MSEKELRRSRSVFPIGTVMKLTDLSARQIRYYEEQDLINPMRNEGNRRMYSLNDIDILLEIKDYLSDGINMAGIKRIYELQENKEKDYHDQSVICICSYCCYSSIYLCLFLSETDEDSLRRIRTI